MELSYYINQSLVSQDDILDLSYYPAYNAGFNFSANIGGLLTYKYSIVDTENINDFTLFITFTKIESYSQILISNDNGTSGFTIGINSCNFLYIESRYNTVFNKIFDKINLGLKNCLIIKKSLNRVTVYKYDLMSNEFESIQTIELPYENLLVNIDPLYLGGSDNAVGLYTRNSVRWFSGTIDQFLIAGISIDETQILKILLGFQPFYINTTVSSYYILSDYSYRFDNPLIESNYLAFTGYFNNINSGIVTSLGTGSWVGFGTGYFNSGSITGRITIGTGLNACLGTGSYLTGSYSGIVTGVSGSTSNFSDFVRYTRNNEFSIISHNISISGGIYGSSPVHLDYDAYYKLSTVTGISSSGVSGDYYTGFKMNGVISEYSDLLILGTDTGVAPSQFNIRANYDNIYNKFYVNDFISGYIYYNGERLLSSNYSIVNNILDVINKTESINDYVIYDNSSGVSLMYLGIDNYAIGDFYCNASLVWSGISSYTGLARMDRDFYKETSSHHLYHGVRIQNKVKEELFRI